MKRSAPLQVVVYQDVLCAWCYITDQRLDALRSEFGDALVWKSRPYALRVDDRVPGQEDRKAFLKELTRARKEPEGKNLSTELWKSADAPRSSVPPLIALEAARMQDPLAARALARSLAKTGLELGLNVSRTDVLFEVAQRLGLHMGRFAAAFESPDLRRLVLDEHKAACERGVRGVPTLVIGERWMISGLREQSEYRAHILECLRKRQQRLPGADPETLH